MLRKLFSPTFIIVAAVIAGILAWSDSTSAVRSGVLFLFMLIVPGMALTRLFKLGDLLTELMVAMALSIAISILLAEYMVFMHQWSPNAALLVLVGISLLGAALQLRIAVKAPAERSEE